MFSIKFKDLAQAIESCEYTTPTLAMDENESLEFMIKTLSETKENEKIIYVIGNGGSAGIASHFSTDLIKALQIPSQTIFDSNLMTCLSNDLGYENVFSYPLEKLLKPHDVLVAISSSGQSINIINAAKVALAKKATLITLTGFLEHNPLRKLGHLNFWIARSDYGLVETSHFFLLHTIIDLYQQMMKDPHEASQEPSQRFKQLLSLHNEKNQIPSRN